MAPLRGQVEREIPGFGKLKGNTFDGGVCQFMGIPYGELAKRWTRATLLTSWKDNFHDGTVLGPCTPVPHFGGLETGDIITPVYQFDHYKRPFVTDERHGLVLNIATGPVAETKNPVFVFIHGGAWVNGTSNLSIYDGVRLVQKSIAEKKPIVVVTLNYRCGISGFLASDLIEKELKEDGFFGNGNFALTDQALALDWLNKNIHLFGGDAENITLCGESAGACSVSNHIFSNINPKFKRAMAMSGLSGTIPAYPKSYHEKHFQMLLKYYNIANDEHALEKLREIPEVDMALATSAIEETSRPTTGNPCIDGWYLDYNLNFTNFLEPPEWLESLVIGNTKDEGLLFFPHYTGLTFDKLLEHFDKFVPRSVSEIFLSLYEITPESSLEDINWNVSKLLGDLTFIFPSYQMLNASAKSNTSVYWYHFDEPSTLDLKWKGKSCHGIDLLYLFGSRSDMNESQEHLVSDYMSRLINFVNGEEPWEPYTKRKALMVFGPVLNGKSKGQMMDQEHDENRNFKRFEKLREIPGKVLDDFYTALDCLTNEREFTS